MKKKRSERLKARRDFLAEQKRIEKIARANEAPVSYAIFSKPTGGTWQLEFESAHETCRDSAFEILKLRTDLEIRRVNV
tara:strand:+ start:9936 stop:10172 length:237 start_codon:yes stop_codon:yes gene_type:complete